MKKSNLDFSFNACCMCGTNDGIWFIHWGMPALFKYSFLKKDIVMVKKIPNISYKIAGSCFKSIVEISDKLFMVPCRASSIVIYDEKKDQFQSIELKRPVEIMFCKGFLVRDELYCVPYYYDWFVRLNVKTLKIEYISTWKEKIGLEKNSFNIDATCMYKDNILGVIPFTNIILSFNTKNCNIKIQKIQGLSNITGICSTNNKVFVYDGDSLEVCVLDNSLKRVSRKKHIEMKNVYLQALPNGKIVADGIDVSRQIIFDENICFEYMTSHKCYKRKFMKSPYCVSCWSEIISNKVHVMYENDEIEVYDNNKCDNYIIAMSEKSKEIICKELMTELGFYENVLFNLENWIQALKDDI